MSYPSTSELAAREVRAELARQRRTSSDMAAALGISQATAQRRLSGKSPFTLAELDQLARWLGVTRSSLTPEIEEASA